MGYIEGTRREQTMIMALDDLVCGDSIPRLIDRFIEICDLKKLGFNHTLTADTGRPSYDPAGMAKLYLYGYESGVRSSFIDGIREFSERLGKQHVFSSISEFIF